MPRIIVKTGYMKGQAHKEYYVNYIATRDGVEKYKSDNGNKNATKRQKELIQKLMNDYPSSINMYEYEDYMNNGTRENASEFISAVIDQNIYDVATKENYVDYISNRPRVEKIGEHGLFSDAGIDVNLNEVVKEVGEHEGNVWTYIISIKREDADRLNYNNVQSWMSLCQSKRNELAKAMNIDPTNLKWYAAFHNEGHHPHVHMIAYSGSTANPKEGFVNQKGIESIRRMIANEIFQNDLLHIYKKQTEKREEIKSCSREKVIEILNAMNSEHYDNQIIFDKIIQLKESLKDYHGRLMYAYIPKKSKQIINDILREMEKDSDLKNLYEEWNLFKRDIKQTYSDKLYQKLPLLEQREFKSLKNMILNEVMNHDDYLFEDINDETSDDNELFERDKMLKEYSHISTINGYIRNNDFDKITDSIDWLEQCELPLAKYILGKIYHDGLYVERDLSMAVKCFTASGENKYAYNRLSNIYKEFGNMNASIHYLHKADEMNYDIAQFKLGKLFIEGRFAEKDIGKGLYYLNKAESQNNQFAQYMLGKLFLFGKDVKQDKELAFEYLTKSAMQGNEYAKYLLEHFRDYQNQSLAMMTSRFFHHVSRIIENEMSINRNNVLSGVEHKLKNKLLKKRSAMGHKADDHSLRF
ncbi:MobP3 family relaxase [uncultured Thomasclavelia sp.]|uniref:MobP3 family relaxase n=1 Tax=uncultured Thomasclavelia sp. TaxID=3025759 RepID=UPI0025982821|nr:MobP3 family relaxase [uncultured Thomasclavelia sp.]